MKLDRLTSAITILTRDEDGATMVEYAFMLALIAAVCAAVVGRTGDTVANCYKAAVSKYPDQ